MVFRTRSVVLPQYRFRRPEFPLHMFSNNSPRTYITTRLHIEFVTMEGAYEITGTIKIAFGECAAGMRAFGCACVDGILVTG